MNFPDVRYGFQGKEVQTTGLADFENRFYAAHQGRFGSRDPLAILESSVIVDYNSTDTNNQSLDDNNYFDYGIGSGMENLGSDSSGLKYDIRRRCKYIKKYIKGSLDDKIKPLISKPGTCVVDEKGFRKTMMKLYDGKLDVDCKELGYVSKKFSRFGPISDNLFANAILAGTKKVVSKMAFRPKFCAATRAIANTVTLNKDKNFANGQGCDLSPLLMHEMTHAATNSGSERMPCTCEAKCFGQDYYNNDYCGKPYTRCGQWTDGFAFKTSTVPPVGRLPSSNVIKWF